MATKGTRLSALLPVLVVMLLYATALRMQHLVAFVEWPDEIRTLWRSQATLENLIIRTPSDWPVTYGLITWGWMRLVGPTLETTRLLSVFFSAIGAAATYRLALATFLSATQNALARRCAALVVALLYAGCGYTIFAGVDARAYSMLLALGPLALWQYTRWCRRPTTRRGIVLAFLLALLLYLSYTSFTLIAFLTLLLLVTQTRLISRWLAVGIITAVMALPIIPAFLNSGVSRVTDLMEQPVPPLLEAMMQLYTEFADSSWIVPLLAIAAVVLALQFIRGHSSAKIALRLLLWLLIPVIVWGFGNNELLKPRYLWWIVIGMMLSLGYLVLYVPRPFRWALVIVSISIAFLPVDFGTYRLADVTSPPLRSTFQWLTQHLRPNDVIVIDPYCYCGELMGWDYFVPLYFPSGYLPIVKDPGDARRVWYLSTDGWERDEALRRKIEAGRMPSIFYGPWNFLLQLYEAPPEPDGLRFGDSVCWHGAELDGQPIMGRNEKFNVRMFWSTDAPLEQDYSISVALLDSKGHLVAQNDGPPNFPSTPAQMVAWQPNTIYEDIHTLQIPADVPDGEYRLVTTVYQWWDGVRLPPQASDKYEQTGDGYLWIETITVVS